MKNAPPMPIVPRSTCATGASAWSRRRSAQRTPTARREKCVRTASVQRQHSGVRATLTARQVKCAQPGGAFRPRVEFSGSSTHLRGCSRVRARPCPSPFSVAEGIRTGSGEPHSVQRCVGLMCSTPSRTHLHPLRQRGLKLATTENGSIRLLDRLLVDHLVHLRARLERRPCSEYILVRTSREPCPRGGRSRFASWSGQRGGRHGGIGDSHLGREATCRRMVIRSSVNGESRVRGIQRCRRGGPGADDA